MPGVAVRIVGGAAVVWLSNTQPCVTLSTTEAEHVSMGDGVKVALTVQSELLAVVYVARIPHSLRERFPK